jgi:hypothetical protein
MKYTEIKHKVRTQRLQQKDRIQRLQQKRKTQRLKQKGRIYFLPQKGGTQYNYSRKDTFRCSGKNVEHVESVQ